jgi:methionyl-tRNA synthetase
MTDSLYVTTAIPYVNGTPHIGHALEFVQADVLARHARLRNRPVRFLTGTDENALKNVQSATAAGVDVATFVAATGDAFAALRTPLALSNDDFIRTASDARHQPTVEWLWAACASTGDLYRSRYEGWYCAGCEQFYEPDELIAGGCPEHGAAIEHVVEDNWFFALSRYQQFLVDAIESGRLRVEPEHRRNEVLAFVRSGLRDFSVSRPAARARGWGIPVPGEPDQVIYVWFDALANYISALQAPDGDAYWQWWRDGDERVHVIGKGIVRFHAVYWPAILQSAGQPLPTTIFVHDYLTVDGAKIAKSAGNAVDPVTLVDRYGTDAVRWWLLREVPRAGDTDFTAERLVASANRDLANGIGNLVQRVRGLVTRVGRVEPEGAAAEALAATVAAAPHAVDTAIARFDFRAAIDALLAIVVEANRYVESTRPWEGNAGLLPLVRAVTVLGDELEPFVPDLAARVRATEREVVFPRLVGVA